MARSAEASISTSKQKTIENHHPNHSKPFLQKWNRFKEPVPCSTGTQCSREKSQQHPMPCLWSEADEDETCSAWRASFVGTWNSTKLIGFHHPFKEITPNWVKQNPKNPWWASNDSFVVESTTPRPDIWWRTYIYNIYNYIYTHIPDWESLTVAVSSQMFTPIARAQHLFLNDPLARCTRFTFGFLTWKASTPNHPGPTWRDDVTAAPMEDIHIEPQTMGASGQLWNIQLQYNFTMVHDNSNPSDMVIVVVMLMVMVIVMVMVMMMMMMVVMMMMVASW